MLAKLFERPSVVQKTTILLSATLGTLVLGGCDIKNATLLDTTDKQKDPWYQSAQTALEKRRNQERISGPARNIILFVADGHGITSNTALRIHDGQQAGNSGEEHILSYERFPHLALSKTYNTDAQISDSAGTASAMLTGVKTRRGVLSVDESVEPGDCIGARGHSVVTALELAENAGMLTGIVSTARLTHATPAAAYAHSASRGFENDSTFSDEQKAAGCRDIAEQFVHFPFGDGVDIALGGGRQNFLPNTHQDREGQMGKRTDNRDLVAEWKQRFPKGQYIETEKEFEKLDDALPIFGLFEASHMNYAIDRSEDRAGEPSLEAMTESAIRLLQKKQKNGFFLLVEAGRVDHAHHAGNAHRALEDGRAYAAAVAKAAELTDVRDTLIIATADHSHTLTMAGYASRGNPILGLSNTINDEGESRPRLANDGHPYTTLSYANGPGAMDNEREGLTNAEVLHKDYKQASLVPLRSETHGGEDVAIYARGPGAWLFDGTVEQHYIFHVMDSVARW